MSTISKQFKHLNFSPIVNRQYHQVMIHNARKSYLKLIKIELFSKSVWILSISLKVFASDTGWCHLVRQICLSADVVAGKRRDFEEFV